MQATAPSALQVFLRAATNLRSATLALSGGGAGTLPWQRMPPKSALLLLLPQQDVASTPHAAALGSWAVSQGLTGLSQTQHLTSRTTGSRPYSQPTTDGAHARGSNASTASSSSNGSRGRAAGGESGNAGARRSGEGTAASGAASASASKHQGGGGWKKGGYWQKHKKREWNGQGGKGWGNSGEAVRAADSRGAGGGSQDQDDRRQGSGGPGAQDTVKGEAKVLAQANSSSSSSSTVGDAGGVARLEGHGEGGIATAGQASEAGAAQVTPAVIAVQPREVLQRGQYTLRLYDLPQRCRTAEEERCLEAALEVVRRLRQGNHSALFAGGWVRDQFMGRPSYDIDIATNADWYQVMQLFGPSYGGGGGGAGAAAGAGAGGGGGATLASSGRCRYKGGTTVDVSVGYHTFEVTSFRGGTRDPGEEAEWRDAALRDFTINALFFEPELPPAAAASAKPQQQQLQQQKEQPMASGAAAAPPPPPTTTTGAQSPCTTHEAGGDPSAPAVAPAPEASAASAAPPPAAASEAPVPAPPADPQSLQASQATTPTRAPAPPAASPQPLQLRGVVKDYVGGVEDLERRVLRVYPHFRLLGHSQSSVEADPIRVLRAARMAEDLGLAVHPHSEALIRRAAPLVRVSGKSHREAELGDADKAPGSRQYVTRSRVLRELAKMNDMDVRHVGSTAAVASPAVGASKHEQDGGAANGGGDGSGGGSGSVRFGAALERCREWGALEALLPKLQQAGLPQVLTSVFPRLPAALPLELKLACLVVGHGPLPSSTLEQYENVRLLTGEAQRPAQTPWCHMLCNLTALMREDKMAARCKVLWRELLARRQTDLVVQAFGAFVPPTALPGLHELVEAHRATLLQDKQQQQQGQEQRQQQQQFYGRQQQQQQQQQQRYKAGTRDGGRQ